MNCLRIALECRFGLVVFGLAMLPMLGGHAQSVESTPPAPAEVDLQTALDLALENNFAIRQSRARYVEAGGALTESRSGQLPTVALAAGYTRIDQSRFDSFNGQSFGNPNSWQAGATVSQNLYTGGAVSSSIRASEASLEAVEAEFAATLRDALLAVRQGYYGVLLTREQVGVQEQSVALLEEELANARTRVEVGSGSPFEQLRAEVALANGQTPLIRARNAYRIAAVELFRNIGLVPPSDAETRIIGELTFAADEYTLEALLASAEEQRPELRRLGKLVVAAEEAVEVARAGARPTVGVFAGYDFQNSTFSDSIGDYTDGWSIGVQGSWNIFDGRATKGRVAQAQARKRQTELTLQETRLVIDAEIRRAFSSYREAQELVRSSQKVVEQAEESVRLARARFDAGGATQLDVLQTQVALTEAASNKALALHDANIALANLQRAAGLLPIPGDPRVED